MAPKFPIAPLYAAVDIGSHNVRMDLYGLDDAGKLVRARIPERTVFPCTLAEGTTEKKPAIRRENLLHAEEAVRQFNAILTHYNIAQKNICAVMTAAMRAVQDTKLGQEDIQKLVEALGRPAIVITGKEEARLVGEAVKIGFKGEWNGKSAFAAIGGGSVELGMIHADGGIHDPIALHYGVHTLGVRSRGRIPRAGKIFEHALQRHYPHHKSNVIFATGGVWRDLGKTIYAQDLPVYLNGKATIRKQLISATHRKPAEFSKMDKSNTRADFMPVGAAMLRRIAMHFDAKKVIFLESTMRDAMVDIMYRLNLNEGEKGALNAPPHGLERLFVPKAQVQVLHV